MINMQFQPSTKPARRFRPRLLLSGALLAAAMAAPAYGAARKSALGPGVGPFTVRPGYRVTLVCKSLHEARFLTFDNHGTLFVSQPGHGRIMALRDPNSHGVFQKITTFVKGYSTVQGLCARPGWLWFTQSGAVYRVADNGTGTAGKVITVIPNGKLPHGGAHWWRSILVGKKHFYTSIGDPQNFSDQTKGPREKIWEYRLDGTHGQIFCGGLRNTEQLHFRPGTHEIWGCDEGSDQFGYPLGEHPGDQPITDMNPPDKFNYYVRGAFYGQPFITGNRIPRYEYLNKPGVNIIKWAAKTTVPAWDFHAHWSTVAFCFIKKHYFPGETGDAFVACHGSWDSTKKVGYCVARVLFDKLTGKPFGLLKIVSTLAANGHTVLARPVDCTQGPDGSVYFTSDSPPRVYRITYIGPPDASD